MTIYNTNGSKLVVNNSIINGNNNIVEGDNNIINGSGNIVRGTNNIVNNGKNPNTKNTNSISLDKDTSVIQIHNGTGDNVGGKIIKR